MGRTRQAMAATALGSFTATANGTNQVMTTPMNGTFYLRGTFVATVVLEASDDGVTYSTVKDVNGTAVSLTAPGAVNVTGCFPNVRARCSAFTSGTAVATFAQAPVA